jgi:hypothetical protein
MKKADNNKNNEYLERDINKVDDFRTQYHNDTLTPAHEVWTLIHKRVLKWCRSFKRLADADDVEVFVIDKILTTPFGTKPNLGPAPLQSFIDTTTKRRIFQLWRKHDKNRGPDPVGSYLELKNIGTKVVKRMESEVFMKELLQKVPGLQKIIFVTIFQLYSDTPPSKRAVINEVYEKTGGRVSRYMIGIEYDKLMRYCRNQYPERMPDGG